MLSNLFRLWRLLKEVLSVKKTMTETMIISTSGTDSSCFQCSYFELESSGLRDEIRYHYRFNGKTRTEVFPYRLADGQWHKIAVSLSASHLLLHVDCNR